MQVDLGLRSNCRINSIRQNSLESNRIELNKANSIKFRIVQSNLKLYILLHITISNNRNFTIFKAI
jgi:hypothetical protein